MSFRGILALGLLVAAVGAERLAFYGGRAFFAADFVSGGMTTASFSLAFSAMSIGGIVATFVGAGISFGVGPRLTAAIGILVAALGFASLALDVSLVVGWGLITIGSGIFRVCPYAAAAEVLATQDGPDPRVRIPNPQRFVAVSAFAVLAYATIHLSASIAAPLAAAIRDRFGRGATFGFESAVAFTGALLAGAAALAGALGESSARTTPPNDPYRAPATSAPSPAIPLSPSTSLMPLAGAGLLAVGVGIFDLGESVGTLVPSTFNVARSDYTAVYSLAAIGVTVASLVLFVLLLVATLARWSTPPLTGLGAGIAVAGVGMLVKAAAGYKLGVFAAGMLLTALGEAAVPIGTAYAALTVRGRASALVLAGWMGVMSIASLIGSPLAPTQLRTPVLILLGLACIGGGVAAVAFARRLQHGMFER